MREPSHWLAATGAASRSGFHGWERRAPSDRALADVWLLEQIREIHKENKKVYGGAAHFMPSCASSGGSASVASVWSG